jgi:hypothetical protein
MSAAPRKLRRTGSLVLSVIVVSLSLARPSFSQRLRVSRNALDRARQQHVIRECEAANRKRERNHRGASWTLYGSLTAQSLPKHLANTVGENDVRVWIAAEPFVWTATADSIFAKVERLCERIYGTAH